MQHFTPSRKEGVSFYGTDQPDEKVDSGNFYSHSCRLGACPDLLFFIALPCSLSTDVYKCRSNCPQAKGNHVQAPGQKKKKKGKEEKTLPFSFKMKEICKPSRMRPQGVGGAEHQSRDDGREARQ